MISVKGQSAAELPVEEQGLPSANIPKFVSKCVCIYKELAILNEMKTPFVHCLIPSLGTQIGNSHIMRILLYCLN